MSKISLRTFCWESSFWKTNSERVFYQSGKSNSKLQLLSRRAAAKWRVSPLIRPRSSSIFLCPALSRATFGHPPKRTLSGVRPQPWSDSPVGPSRSPWTVPLVCPTGESLQKAIGTVTIATFSTYLSFWMKNQWLASLCQEMKWVKNGYKLFMGTSM